MSGQGSGSGGQRRSDRLAKGKAVLYEPESPPDTDDEYDAMEDVRTRVDASIARNLQAELDAEAAGLASSAARPSSRPGITIGHSARPSGVPRQPAAAPTAAPPARSKRQRSDRTPLSADPIPEDYAAPGFRYPPRGGIRPRYPVTTPVADTPLLTGLHGHPSSSVRRCEDPPAGIGRGAGWRGSSIIRGPSILAPARWGCSLSTGVPFWVIRFGGRIPPSDPMPDFEALEILGIDDPAAVMEEPPTELRYRQWTAYFIFSCFLGNDKSTIPTPIVGMFRDIDALRDYDWGALTSLSSGHLSISQYSLPADFPVAPDSVFPLARRWDSAWIQRLTVRTLMECRTTVDCIRDIDIVFQPYSTFLLERPEAFRAVELSRLWIWIRSPRSWELLMGERTLRQLGGEALVPVDPPHLMTIEDYIPRAPSDSYVEGVEAYPDLIRVDMPYQEWFERVSLGPLMSLHEVEGGRLELSVCEDRYKADMDRLQEEAAQREGEMTQMRADLAQSQRDLDSRDAEVARFAATVQRLEEQLQGMGITPVTGAGSSGFGQTSSTPPPDPCFSRLVLSTILLPHDCTMGFTCATFLGHLCISRFPGRARVSGPVLDLQAWFSALGPPYWQKIDPDHVSFGSMASSSNDPDSLVTLHFHDFRVERMRHWWTLLGEDDHADIVGVFRQVDLVPTLEEYAGLLQLGQPLSARRLSYPFRSPRSNRVLEKYLGLTSAVLHSEIIRPEETWRKANISLDLQEGMEEIPNQRLQDCLSQETGRGGSRCSAHSSFSFGSAVTLRHFYRLQTPYHFERHTVSQTVKIVLPFTGNSRDWALYLLDLPLGEWSWKVTWGPAVWRPWTHCALFDGVPLPGVWGCMGYYPSLALRQFGGVQYPPRLGDLDAVTFDYIPGEDMWRLLSRIEVIWGRPPSRRPTVRPGASYSLVSRSLRVSASTGQFEKVTVLERELEEARAELSSLRLARASEREESAARVESMRSTFASQQCGGGEPSPRLGGRRGLGVQDELDSLRSYTQALVDPTTGRPHDIVALRRALDESEAALTSARTSIGAMRVQISVLQGDNGVLQTELDLVHDALESNASWLNQEGFPVVTALHQINQVMDSLGARARAVLEEHDEGDPALSTALGRFCRETCIRLGH
uniref:Aminotransferase-like plant mobile domain-containing protein n=1 Tax=Fagus sylvatica TaxID=28930 RepID=A0A2N9FA29_FAGSY